jgi:hypothetical protein
MAAQRHGVSVRERALLESSSAAVAVTTVSKRGLSTASAVQRARSCQNGRMLRFLNANVRHLSPSCNQLHNICVPHSAPMPAYRLKLAVSSSLQLMLSTHASAPCNFACSGPTEGGCAGSCAKSYGKCAGKGISGVKACCNEKDHCVFRNKNYSQCRPKSKPLPSWPDARVLSCGASPGVSPTCRVLCSIAL